MNTMFKKSLICLAFVMLLCIQGFQAKAQNQQFSQFYNTDLLVNPALVASDNDTKITFNYRREALGSVSNYSNPMLSFSRPLVSKSSEGDITKRWGGVGAYLLQDQVKTPSGNALQTLGLGLNYAHNLQIASNHFISFGAQVSYYRKSLNISGLQSEQQLLGQGVTDPVLLGGNLNKGIVSFNVGTMWYQTNEQGKRTRYLGVSTYHLNRPSLEFNDSPESSKQAINFVVNGGIEVFNNEKLSIEPNFRWIANTLGHRFNIGASGNYKLNEEHILGVGSWWSQRVVVAGLNYSFRNFFIGLSYDIPIDAQITGNATEITIGYRKTLGSK